MSGVLYGLGLGPGDPELVTMKAVRLLRGADLVAYPTARAGTGVSLSIIQPYLEERQELLPLVYPVTAGPGADAPEYRQRIDDFYDETAEVMAVQLAKGRSVALACVGDPFFYGSFMFWYARLAARFETVVVPGISSILAGPVAARTPLCFRTQTVTVIPGTLPEDEITRRLKAADAAVIMKLGRTFGKVRKALDAAGLLDKATYIERASMDEERVLPAADVEAGTSPYFSIVMVPGGVVE